MEHVLPVPKELARAVEHAAPNAGFSDSATERGIPDRLQTLTAKSEYWATVLSIEADRLRNRQRAFGYPVVAITAITGMTIFTQLENDPSTWSKIAVASLSIFAAVLAAIQTQQNFSNRAAEASQVGSSFGDLFGDLLDAEDEIRSGSSLSIDRRETLYARYTDLKKARPAVPERVCKRASRQIERDARIRRVVAEARYLEVVGRPQQNGP
jgi:hypothetical protein